MRLEHLRGTTLGFRNPTHHIARSMLEASGLKPDLHPHLRRAPMVPHVQYLISISPGGVVVASGDELP